MSSADSTPLTGTWSQRHRRFGADPRISRTLAGLAGLALLASLVGEWFQMSLSYRTGGFEGTQFSSPSTPVPLGELGPYGIGWLLGTLGLLVCLALAMTAKQPRMRAAARAVGQTVTVVLAGLLLVLGAILMDPELRNILLLDLTLREVLLNASVVEELGLTVSLEAGRGLIAALVGLGLSWLALWLSGVGGTAKTPTPASVADPVAADEPEAGDAGPDDLRVAPARPFNALEGGQ